MTAVLFVLLHAETNNAAATVVSANECLDCMNGYLCEF
jgi:hypothetical protein